MMEKIRLLSAFQALEMMGKHGFTKAYGVNKTTSSKDYLRYYRDQDKAWASRPRDVALRSTSIALATSTGSKHD